MNAPTKLPIGRYYKFHLVTSGGNTQLFGRIINEIVSHNGQQHYTLDNILVNNEGLNFYVSGIQSISTTAFIDAPEPIPSGVGIFIKIVTDKVPNIDPETIELLVEELEAKNILAPDPTEYGMKLPSPNTPIYTNIEGEDWGENADADYGGGKYKRKSRMNKKTKKRNTQRKRA
jgi:hypothetical protein